MQKNIFIFDENKCVGCHACVVACINENGFQSPERWRNVLEPNPQHHPGLPIFYYSLACNHCDEAPCMHNCPSLAFYKDVHSGAIVHEVDKCLGCKYCTWVCPYDAPKFNPDSRIIEKCTFCPERMEEGLKPACASLCPVGALEFGREDFNREESFESSPIPIDIGSSLKTIKLRSTEGPKMDPALHKDKRKLPIAPPDSKNISSAEEWPLVSFSLLSAWLVALYFIRQDIGYPGWIKWTFPAMAILAVVLSFLHLGKKYRYWRAIMNFNRSWLSREIFFFTFFLITLLIDIFIYDLPEGVMILNGFMFLVSMDMLYAPATWRWKVKIHSAQVIFIVTSIWLLAAGYEVLFLLVTIVRGGIFASQKGFRGRISSLNRSLGFLRIILPVVIISMVIYSVDFFIILIPLLLSDVIDRMEFYEDLNVPDPTEEIFIWSLEN